MKFTAMNDSGYRRKTLWVKEGQPVKGVFVGDPHHFRIHWINRQMVTCLGLDCEHCGKKNESKFRFSANFVHKDWEGKLVSTIYEADWFTYDALYKLNEETPLDEYVVEITKGKNAAGYDADLFKIVSKMDDVQKTAIAGVKLHDLVEPVADYSNQTKEKENFDDIPF